jgi:hypothetical protein
VPPDLLFRMRISGLSKNGTTAKIECYLIGLDLLPLMSVKITHLNINIEYIL